MDCCYLVGTLAVDPSCITSIQVQSSTEASKIAGTIIQGPTIGSINISGYASDTIHKGCPGRAGVSIDWLRKYDCDNDMVYLIFAGGGRSYIYGDIGGLAKLEDPLQASYEVLNASAANGPTSLYEKGTQEDGFGLSYTGGPISFTVNEEPQSPVTVGDFTGLYLQSFTLQCVPGSLPVATYNFIYLPLGNVTSG